MKKTTLLLVIILAFSVLFFSCGNYNKEEPEIQFEPESFDDLWQFVDKNMNALKSYRIDTKADIDVEVNQIKIDGDINMQSIIIGTSVDENLYLYNEAESVIMVDGNISSRAETVLAYSDGKMYVCNKTDENTSKIYSDMTAEKFYAYFSEAGDGIDVFPGQTYEQSMEKTENGVWELRFWNYDRKQLAEILDSMGFTSKNLGFIINDICVTMTLDKQFRVANIRLDFKTDLSEEPAITMDMRYSDYNKAEKKSLDQSEYQEVCDARIVGRLKMYIDDAIYEPNGSFTFNSKQTLKDKTDTKTISRSEETDVVEYSNGNGGFYYSVDANYNGKYVSIDYFLGDQTIKSGVNSRVVDQTEDEAYAFIQQLIDPLKFDPSLVTGISEIKDGRYRIDLITKNAFEYGQAMMSLGDKYEGYELYIIVNMDEEKISVIETHLLIIGEQSKLYNDSVMTIN